MPFQPGNPHAKAGGHARAKALTPQRRSEIARSGYQATTQRHFNGDADAHKQWFVAAGLAAQDASYPPWMRVWVKALPHPAHVSAACNAVAASNGDIDFEDCRPNQHHEN